MLLLICLSQIIIAQNPFRPAANSLQNYVQAVSAALAGGSETVQAIVNIIVRTINVLETVYTVSAGNKTVHDKKFQFFRSSDAL